MDEAPGGDPRGGVRWAEISTLLSERLADEVEVTLIDQNDAFTLGFSKLDILFHHQTRDDVRLPYRRLAKPGVAFRQETVLSIDPQRRQVATNEATYHTDFLVVALGADYDLAATPGFVEGGFEYYSVDGAERLRDELPLFRGGNVLLAVLSIPFKCPPAPYEGILLLHDYLVERGIRDAAQLHVVTPQPAPIPVSSQASKAVERTMAARGIEYTKHRRVYGIDPADKVAHFKDHDEPYDLFIGIPVHKVPDVLVKAGLTENGWVRWTLSPSPRPSLASTRSAIVPRRDPQGRCLRRVGRPGRRRRDRCSHPGRPGQALRRHRPVLCGDGRRRGGPGRCVLPGRGRAYSSTAGTEHGVRSREGRLRSDPSGQMVRCVAPSRHIKNSGDYLTMLRTLGIALAPRTATWTRPRRLLVPPARPRQIALGTSPRGKQGRLGHRTAQPKRRCVQGELESVMIVVLGGVVVDLSFTVMCRKVAATVTNDEARLVSGRWA